MARARKSAAKARKTKRGMKAGARRRTKVKARSRPRSKTKRQPARKSGPKKQPGMIATMGNAVQAVSDTYRDAQEMRERIGKRGGFEDA